MDIDLAALLASPFTIGALGAAVGLKFSPEVTWRGRGTAVACGLLTAGFIAPGLVEWLKLPGLINLFSFGIGLLGMNMLAALFKGITSVDLGAIITGWISRRG